MPITLIVQSSAPYTNLTGGLENVGPISYVGTMTPFDMALKLAMGSNVITVPTPVSGVLTGVMIILPSTGGVTVLYKEVLNDTGIYIPQTSAAPFLRFFDQSNLPTSIYLYAASAMTSPTSLRFF